ncbi:FliM/FliN family flagellar motor C-terminal domain-containing protein [Achromobacter deleyi]|uniref:FliM/FliN family flagellar motor C-terminal domain-containing protein n=1 Tax=Achromobacter deleyi TaxID=1353891 RepID=UPI001490A0E5|nr:FliM/FliN family flagellar motor C-terminal domain-containing protein [Achromobacter deleyi]QVQ26151.1 FliM/FliN family flagellar motor switch protein [Achromobacter deleyi]UIP21713.1 FliM/FliN family flagellar motor C-terminal domain-containing protein [Achromobacter deleyi]
MTVWTIAWWTQAEMERAADSVRGALLDWCGQWGVDPGALRAEPASWPAPAAAAGWQCVTGSGDRNGAWMTHPDMAARGLAAAVCDEEREAATAMRQGGPLSLSVARQAARAMLASLRADFDWSEVDHDQPCALPAGLERGGLSLSVWVGDAQLGVVLSAGVARAVTGRVKESPSLPLAALQDVLGRRGILLDVALRPVRLEIGSLCSLAIGDVIALDHKLDEPATLYAEDASPVARAHLSRVGPQKAIRLERAAA